MKDKIKNAKGITLVTLVVTIVIIIILATISINFMFGDNGLITRAEEAKEMHAISSIKEKMEIAKGTAFIDGEGYIDPDRYFDILEEENVIIDKDTDVVEIEDGVYEVTTEPGYIFEVTLVPSKDDVDDIEIDYVGKGENLGPRIEEIKVLGKTTNSINIEIDAKLADGAEYTYWIKKESEGEEDWREVEGNKNTCSFTNLEVNVVYNIKVKVETKNGTDEKEISTLTGELPVGTITFTDIEWIGDGTAKIRINTSAEGYTLQYQVNGIEEGNWKNTTSGAEITGLEHGQTVYGRLFDGTNGTKDDASADIVDEIAPTVIVTEGAKTTNSIAVNVVASDGQSGMQSSPTYTYYIKESSAGDTSYTAKEIGTTANSYTFTGLKQETSYDVKVEVNGDKALNTGEGKLLNQTTGIIGGAEGGLVTGNIVASSPVWANGTASITLSTNTGLTIQYQVGGIAEGNWKTGTSVTGLEHNDTVYARLTDGNNYGDHASVTIKDITPPTISNITTSNITEDSITVTVTASDAQSGLATSGTYKYYLDETLITTIKENTYTYEGLNSDISYTLKVEVFDKAGNLNATTEEAKTIFTPQGGTASDIASHPKSYYGLEVMGYDCDGTGVSKWRIFYADNSNIYLIANAPVAYNLCPSSKGGSKPTASVNGNAYVYFDNIYDEYSGSKWIKENSKANLWMKDFLTLFPNYSSISMGATCYIMDTDAWSLYQGDAAEWAIGSPTVELYCASYKQIYPNLYLQYRVYTPGVYQFKWSDSGDDDWNSSSYNDPNLQFGPSGIYSESYNQDYGTWLAGPAWYDDDRMVAASRPRIGYWDVTHRNSTYGLRPIICLKSDVILEKVYDDLYRISNY